MGWIEAPMKRLTRLSLARVAGWAPFALALVVGALTWGIGAFSDEADTLAVGAAIRDGSVLYRDLFSHHFPFPYYWMAGVALVFGRSIFWARISLLLFQLFSLWIAATSGRQRAAVGVAALVWSLLRLSYRGNLLLYSSFCSAAIATVFVLVFGMLADEKHSKPRDAVIVGLFSAAALLSDPLSVYAIAIAMLILLTKSLRRGAIALVALGLPLLAYLGYLILSRTLDDFWRDAVVFNAAVYSKYLYTNPLRLRELGELLLRGLGIAERRWYVMNPLKPITSAYGAFDQWFFAGFFYRAACLIMAALLALQKRWREAAYTYLFSAATLVINEVDFRAQPFVLVAVIAGAMVASGALSGAVASRAGRVAHGALRVGLSLIAAWLVIRVAAEVTPPGASWRQLTQLLRGQAEWVESLACHQPGTRLGLYPGGSSIYAYWSSGMRPVSRYLFLWPWVAESGEDEVIEALRSDDALALVILQDMVVWGKYDSRVFLDALHKFLSSNYIQVQPGVYRSPALAERCQEQGP